MDKKIIKFDELKKSNDKRVKEVITDYEKLSERCDEVDTKKKNLDIQDIVLDLKATLRANPDMTALSSIQIGHDKRVIVINFNGDLRTFVNPIITESHGMQLSREKCHSIPGKEFIRLRSSKITVIYQTPLGKVQSVELMGLAAIIMQHQIDHLDGLLLSDIGLEIDEDFDKASEDEQNEVIQWYLDSLDVKEKEIEMAIENDEDAKRMKDAVRFIQSVNSGETKLEEIPWTDEQIKIVEEYKKEQEREKSEAKE